MDFTRKKMELEKLPIKSRPLSHSFLRERQNHINGICYYVFQVTRFFFQMIPLPININIVTITEVSSNRHINVQKEHAQEKGFG